MPEPWSPRDVVNQVGDVVVPIVHITDGDYMNGRIENRTVADYYAAITSEDVGNEIPYLAELSYDEHFPELAAQLVEPPKLRDENFGARVMYFGSGTHSQIHHHVNGSAMLFCIHGTKIVRLYAPSQTTKLYKVPGRNFSGVLINSVGENSYSHDAETFPEFADAEYVEYEVRAGQTLFIPIWWWHSIQNLDEVSLTAVYFWDQNWHNTWRDFFPKQLPPRAMRRDYVTSVVRRRVVAPVKKLIKR